MKEVAYKWFFKAVSNPTRLALIRALRDKPKTVSQLCRELHLEQSLASHSLKCLATCGFVTKRPHGKERIYALDHDTILPLLTAIDTHIQKYYTRLCACCDEVKQLKAGTRGARA